jgi:FkbM family methyltransferase
MDNIKKVYDMLEDPESKYIFAQKLMFCITGDFGYVFNISDNYVKYASSDFQWRFLLKQLQQAAENKSIVIYGAGGEGDALCAILESAGIAIDCFCDRNEKLNGMKKKPVILPDELIDRYRTKNDCVIIIGTEMFHKEIYDFLTGHGVKTKDIFGGAADFELQYFDKEIINFSDPEVFVDGGALNLGTSRILLDKCKTVRRIYAFEPDKTNYMKCLKVKESEGLSNIEVLNLGLYEEKDTLKFSLYDNGSSHISESGNSQIEVVSLDEILPGEKITFIKMDIEGAELKALKGAADIIRKNRPKLAISVYHKQSDMIDIPLFLKSVIPDYRLYIRHYSIYPAETVLYAV